MLFFRKKLTAEERQHLKDAATPDIVRNPYVIKKVRRNRWMKRMKWAVALMALPITASTVTVVGGPDTVSSSLDEHMQARGFSQGLQKHFRSSSIRVYEGSGLLVPFHQAGLATQKVWRSDAHPALKIIATPIAYGVGLSNGFGVQQVFGAALPGKAVCYISPPQVKMTVGTLYKAFTGTSADVNSSQEKNERLNKFFYHLAMMHEARHCDQDTRISGSPFNEADADIYALNLSQPLLAKGEFESAAAFWHALRLTAAVSGGDAEHFTSGAITQGGQSLAEAYDVTAALKHLSLILEDAGTLNAKNFQAMDRIERDYHLSRALLARGALSGGAAHIAQEYVMAVGDLNKMSGGLLLKTAHDKISPGIDLSFLSRETAPLAPEKAPSLPKPFT